MRIQNFITLFFLLFLWTLIPITTLFAESHSKAGPRQDEWRLSLRSAIQLALTHNYDLLLALERVQEAEGVADTRRGALLPNLSGSTSGRNLKTFQGEFGGNSAVSTPRDIFDLRGQMTQSLFSVALLQRWQASRTGVHAAELDAAVAKRDTMATISLLYFNSVRADDIVQARTTNVKSSRALWKMTEGRQKGGAATGIDVTRAQVQYQNDRQRLLTSITEKNQTHFNLLRNLGLTDDRPLILSDDLQYTPVPIPSRDHAIQLALVQRTEIQAQKQRVKLALLTRESIRGERIPSLDFRGDYGLVGEDFDRRFGTYNFGAFLSIPLFDGGQREGRILESTSQLRQEIIRGKDLVNQITLEVRNALLTLHLTKQQVMITNHALELSRKELRLSQKAFSIGTLTHLEVFNAQRGVAETQDQAIETLFNFKAAQINLARAQGKIEEYTQAHRQYVLTPS